MAPGGLQALFVHAGEVSDDSDDDNSSQEDEEREDCDQRGKKHEPKKDTRDRDIAAVLHNPLEELQAQGDPDADVEEITKPRVACLELSCWFIESPNRMMIQRQRLWIKKHKIQSTLY
jgi:hypothetical protein